MVVVKHGALPPPGKQFKVYLNVDKLKQKWYLRVTHTFPQYNQHFRAGTYKSKEQAMEALKSLDPINPKKGRQRKGTVDQYNGQWRVRAKHRGEHMHVGYFKDREKAEQRLKEVIQNTEFLEKRYNSLMAKRKRKRESMNHSPVRNLTTLHAKLKKMEQRDYNSRVSERKTAGYQHCWSSLKKTMIGKEEHSSAFTRPAFEPRPSPDPIAFANWQSPFQTLFDQSETDNHLLAVAQWKQMQNSLFQSNQKKWGTETMEHDVAQRSEEHVTQKKKKVKLLRRCYTCSKTQIIPSAVHSLDSDPRVVYAQCEACKKEPVDVGWCGPAILQVPDTWCQVPAIPQYSVLENKLQPIRSNALQRKWVLKKKAGSEEKSLSHLDCEQRFPQSSYRWCNPRQFTLKPPINYTD